MRIYQCISSSKILGLLKPEDIVPAELDLSGDSPMPNCDIIYCDITTQQMFCADLDVFTNMETFREVTGIEIDTTLDSSRLTSLPSADDSFFGKVRNLFSNKNYSHFTNPLHDEAVQAGYAQVRHEINRHRDVLRLLNNLKKDCFKIAKQVAGVRSKLAKSNLTFAKKNELERSLYQKLEQCESVKNKYYESCHMETLIRNTLKQISNKLELEALCKLEMCVAKMMKLHQNDIDSVDLEACARAIYSKYSVKHQLVGPCQEDMNLVLETCCSDWVV